MGVAAADRRRDPGPEPSTVKVTIPSEFSHGREVQKRILADVKHHDYDDQSVFAITLALEEALINAIKHGNKLDPAKNVDVQWTATPHQIEIIIEDQGPGFERSDVPDPTADENLSKCSGRGILLIEAYMHVAEWTNRGRRLRMIRRNAKDSKSA